MLASSISPLQWAPTDSVMLDVVRAVYAILTTRGFSSKLWVRYQGRVVKCS